MPASRQGKPAKRPAGSSKSTLSALLEEHGLILLYDGNCGLCNGTVQWILKRDRSGTMRFAPLQSAVGREALARLPDLAGVDSVILLHREGGWIKSTAILEVARYVGGIWGLGTIGYVFPRALRDWFYDFVAKHRYRWFGRYDECPIPSPEERQRFLGF